MNINIEIGLGVVIMYVYGLLYLATLLTDLIPPATIIIFDMLILLL